MSNLRQFPTRREVQDSADLVETYKILDQNQRVRALDYYFALFTLLTGVVVGVIFLAKVGF